MKGILFMSNSNNYLGVSQYNELELNARPKLGNQLISAFQPHLFEHYGWPTRVSRDEELIRYIDTQHDKEAHRYYSGGFMLSSDEKELYDALLGIVGNLSNREFGQTIRPLIAPWGALNLFRQVSEIARIHDKPKLNILEVGPGSGYLGALLILAGHNYTSLDITQSLYL